MSGRPGWDETWMAVARVMAARSICRRAGVGAVIVSPSNRIVATGYNGPPANLKTADGYDVACGLDCPRALKGPDEPLDPGYDDCLTIHAELNAIAFCDRTDRERGTLYVTGAICYGCAKVVANSGLARVVCVVNPVAEAHRNPARSLDLLRSCGLEVTVIHPTQETQ